MREIKLTQEQVALVDDEDFDELSQYNWYAVKHRNTFYAKRRKGRSTTYMHHQVIGKPPEGYVTDHKDCNGLHNWEDNLRFTTNRENLQYKNIPNLSSQYPGVSWNVNEKKWFSRICINGKIRYLGLFTDEKEAAKAYLKVMKETEKIILPCYNNEKELMKVIEKVRLLKKEKAE